MIFDLIQTSKFLYGGAFAIVGKEGVVGDAKMKSPITGLRAGDSVDLPEWSIGFRRHAIRMAPTHAHDYERNDAEMPTDVCAVQVDGAAKGEVYLARVREHQKKALLNLIPTRYRIARMRCAGSRTVCIPPRRRSFPRGGALPTACMWATSRWRRCVCRVMFSTTCTGTGFSSVTPRVRSMATILRWLPSSLAVICI